MPTVSRAGTAVQSTPADCRHAREPFDALFGVIGQRTDISPGAKLLYGKLVTMHRVGAAWTQAEIGAALGTCRQNVWRWTRELVGADLLLVVRMGLGRPNSYSLLGVAQEDLDGSAPRVARTGSGHQDDRPPVASRAGTFPPKNRTKEPERDGLKAGADAPDTRRSASRCWVCPGRHPLDACPEYAPRREASRRGR